MRPRIHDSCFVHRTAVVLGDVEIGKDCGIWPNAVIRGDENSIVIGERSNVQDNCVIHVDASNPTRLGDDVSLGHGSIVHGATIEDRVIVGMNAVVLNGAVIGSGSMVAAGAVVKQGMKVLPGSLVAGVPARIIREKDASLGEYALRNAEIYVELAGRHRAGEFE